ncbi:MAG: 3-hydroxy-3-methylglutaryl-CoA reductase, partial [Methanomicrobiales archaeon]|nr:3-hydroxy-3-methylglutaryl-CoA reductase [Methanomicrobiales archaeon]
MDEYIERLKDGSLKLYALEKELPPEEAVRVRRAFVEGETGTALPKVGSFTIDIDRVVKRNIENMIGAVQVPLGVAGPIRVKGEYADGSYYLPLATTEGALVASVNRGCSLVTRAGGADVRVMRDGMTRAPVFAARDVPHARDVAAWVESHVAEIREVAESTTKHGEFREAVTYVAGTSVFVRLEFDTKDAMGMNMVTIAGQKVGELIERETRARLVATSGNMCTDKKPAAINLVRGRGKTVVAGVRLTDAMVADLLKTDTETLLEVNYRKNLVGSAR